LLALVLLVVVLAGIGFMMFRSDPRWYRALNLSEAQQIAGQQRLLDRLATLRNAVGQTQANAQPSPEKPWPAYDIEITEDEVNSVLTRWSQSDPRVREALGDVTEPHVRFLRGQIEIAGRSTSLGSLVNIGLTVAQSPKGPTVTLGRPWAGRLPLSRELVEEPGEQGVAALRRGEGMKLPEAVIDSFARLIAGEAVSPVIPLDSSLQGGGLLAARVEKLTIEEGTLKATLRPIHPAK
jgi:hypothetical protein